MSSDILCGFTGDREAALMAYLYEESTPADRAEFETHLATCARCRVELNGLAGVRAQLARWVPPDYAGARNLSVLTAPTVTRAAAGIEPPRPASWRNLPAWAQFAAAMLVLGVSAGLANLNVHYDSRNGLNVRTGWRSSAADGANSGSPDSNGSAGSERAADRGATHAELTALEQQLRQEIQSHAAASPVSAMAVHTPADADVTRRLKAMVDESERRQQTEIALRIAELMREINVQRQSDLRRIDQNLGMIEDRTGVAVLKNRRMIDMYMQRVSQQQ
jgi:hypothetical protein